MEVYADGQTKGLLRVPRIWLPRQGKTDYLQNHGEIIEKE